MSEHQKDWDSYLPFLLLAYRSTSQESTNASPNLLMLGREVYLPVDVIFGKPPQECPDTTEYITQLQERMESTHEYVRVKLQHSSSRQKRYYDQKINGKTHNTGDLVWLHEPRRKLGLCPKLQRYWKGPFTVIQKINDLLYRIQRSPKSKPKVVHFDRLKEYRKREGPPEMQNQATEGIAQVFEQDSSMLQEISTDMSSEEEDDYNGEPEKGLSEFEDHSSGLGIGEGALQYAQGQSDEIDWTDQSPRIPDGNIREKCDNTKVCVEENIVEVENKGSPLATKETVSERDKDLQVGLGNDPLEVSGPDVEALTSNIPRRSKRTRQPPDRLTYS